MREKKACVMVIEIQATVSNFLNESFYLNVDNFMLNVCIRYNWNFKSKFALET